MALLEKREDTLLLDESPALYVKVDNTKNINLRGENPSCDFCRQVLPESGYRLTESGIFLCQDCFSYLASCRPIAKKTIERALLGNVV